MLAGGAEQRGGGAEQVHEVEAGTPAGARRWRFQAPSTLAANTRAKHSGLCWVRMPSSTTRATSAARGPGPDHWPARVLARHWDAVLAAAYAALGQGWLQVEPIP